MIQNITLIEEKFEAMKLQHQLLSKAYTSIEDVLQLMYENQEKIWWWSWEFNSKTNKKGGYLSHRACARASDLALHWPQLVEDRKIGRFKVYRLRTENLKTIERFLGIPDKPDFRTFNGRGSNIPEGFGDDGFIK